MARNLSDLASEILTKDHTVQEWLRLDQEVNEAIAQSPEEEIQKFADSGAGESLDMICSAYRKGNN